MRFLINKRAKSQAVHHIHFSTDRRTLASGGNDGTVRLWNLVLHEQVAVLEGHGSGVWDIVFSPDGQTLASTSFDGTIKLWRAATEHEIQAQSHLFQELEKHPDFQVTSCHHFITTNINFAYIKSE